MYKSKLQEVCQQRGWLLPTYETSKAGLDHQPQFRATVTINSRTFHSQSLARSSKDAQNEAARLAFHYFSPPSSADPAPTTYRPPHEAVFSIQQPYQPLPTAKVEPLQVVADVPGHSIYNVPGGVALPVQHPSQSVADVPGHSIYNVPGGVALPVQQPSQSIPTSKTDDQLPGVGIEAHHLCKNQLQTYTQKRNLPLPVYSSERQGPPHACRFRGKVMVDGKTFVTREFFPTLNKAELAAAKLALMSLLPDRIEQDDLSYKNLLQELAQRKGYRLPVYTTNVSGEAHFPNFASTVEIGGEVFIGQIARAKKQAEMSAAKVAYIALNPSISSISPNPATSVQDAPQSSSSSLREDLTSYLLENVQPKLPAFSEGVEHRGVESSSAVGGIASSSGAKPTLTNLAINSAIEHLMGMSNVCQNRIFVHPRKEAVTYPPGSSVLPISDDNWVAVKVVAPSVNQ